MEESDIDFVYRGLSDPRVYKFYGVRFHSKEETKEQMEWYRTLEEEQTGIWWKLILKESGEAIGACGFNDWNHEKNRAEIGAWLLPEYWKQGYMQEAMKAVINYGFSEMKLESIVGYVEQGNASSEKMITRFGFELDIIELSGEVKDGEPVVQKTYVLER